MISIAILRERLALPTEDDGKARDILSGIISLWETETKRLWNRRAGFVETLRINTSKKISTIFLKLWPIEAVTKVEERSLSDAAWTELAATDYLVPDLERNRLERIGCRWAPLVRITYTGGYTAGATVGQYETPQDVVEALLLQAQFTRERNVPGRVITQSQNFEGGAGVFLRPDLHPLFAEQVLQRARRV